jgi:ABC-2 type transport system permease protein
MESAMVGAVSAGPARAARPAGTGPVAQLLPRLLPGLPATAFGALVARDVRYWWRDAKRRANVITIAVIGVLVPVIVTAGGGRVEVDLGEGAVTSAASPATVNFTLLFVGAFAASVLANQFGFDGTSYAANLTAGVPGRRELRARAVGHAILIVPVLVLVGLVAAVMLADPAAAPGTWGVMFAGYGTGIAVNTFLSVLAAYPLPETSNPFATASGAGLVKSLLALVAIVVAYVVAAPVLAIAAALGDAWPWVALPVGVGYGAGAAALGCYLAGDVLERRAPELLATITPGR